MKVSEKSRAMKIPAFSVCKVKGKRTYNKVINRGKLYIVTFPQVYPHYPQKITQIRVILFTIIYPC